MLVLSRKTGEGIHLTMRNEDGTVLKNKDGTEKKVVIRLVDITGGQKARIGIEAPQDITILREELLPRDDDQPVTVAK